MTLLVKNSLFQGEIIDLFVENGIITAMGVGIGNAFPQAQRVIDAQNMWLVPGLVNGHTHAAMTLFRGFGDDMPLREWLQTRIWPAEAKLTFDDVYWGTRLACLEMIKSGTLFFQDMYWHFHAVAQAVEDSGIRAAVGAIMIDVLGQEQGEEFRRLTLKILDETTRYSDRIIPSLTPHAIYTVSEKNLTWLADLSERHHLPLHIHLSETQGEVDESLHHHQMRPAFYLDRLGLLNERVSLAHGVFLADDEWELIAKRGASVVTNPVSNMKLAVGGVFNYRQARQVNAHILLGSDGAASNNSLDLFQDMKFFSLLQKHDTADPTTLPADEMWAIATGEQAGYPFPKGRMAVGETADFLLLNPHHLALTPSHHWQSNLVYAATGDVVDTAVVAGRILMQQRKVDGEDEVLQMARQRAKQVCSP